MSNTSRILRRFIPISLALAAAVWAAVPAPAAVAAWFPTAPAEGFVPLVAADPQTGQVVAATHASGLYLSNDRGRTWTGIGPTPISEPSLLAAAGGVVYAATALQLLRSTDAGASWQPAGPAGLVTALAVAPATPQTVYFAMGGSVLRTDDAGVSWQGTAGSALGQGQITALAVDPGDRDTVYATAAGSGSIFSSQDGGRHWQAAGSPGASGALYTQLVVDPGDPATLYLANSGAALGSQLLRSSDHGLHWTVIGAGLPRDGTVQAIAALSQPGPRLYVATVRLSAPRTSLFLSHDRGATWQLVNRIPAITSLAVDPAHPRRLYAGTFPQAALWSADGGAHWAQGDGLLDVVANGLAFDPTTSGTVYFSTSRGLLKSGDDGLTWTLVNANTGSPHRPADYVNRLAADPLIPGTLYLSTVPGNPSTSLYKSTDGGRTLQATSLPPGLLLEALAIDPGSSRHVLAVGTGATSPFAPAAWSSNDGGATWTSLSGLLGDLPEPGSFAAVRFGPAGSGAIYLGGDRSFRSADGGKTWSPLSVASPIWDLAVDPAHPNVVYATAPNLLKSTDGGNTWQPVPGFTTSVRYLALDPQRPGTLYAAGTDEQVYESSDGGAHWTSTGLSGLIVNALAVDPFHAGRVFAGTIGYGGLYAYPTP